MALRIERVAWKVPGGERNALFRDIEIVGNFFHGVECHPRGIAHRTDGCGEQETVIHLKRILSREVAEPLPPPGV